METQYNSAVIIDDEADGRDMIALLLEQFFPDIYLSGKAESVAKGIKLINTHNPDIIFLDIEMPDGNAFDLLSQCTHTKAHVILVTAHEQYALRAIKASVIDYLLKPVSKTDFIPAVNKVLTESRVQTNSDWSELILQARKQFIIRKIRIPTLNGFSLMSADDIMYCQASGNYTQLYLADKRKLMTSKTLGEFEVELKSYGFIRIHHKHLVNVNYILEYNKGKKGGGFVVIRGQELLEVSARKKADLLRIFGA